MGYAKEITKEAHEKELEWIARHVKAADIVITSALVPGKRAPVLITEEAVRAMKPGSVIVDLAAEGGGNCALSEPGCDVVKHGVTILARQNVPSLMPHQASLLYARNVAGLFYEVWKKDGLHLDLENEIVKGALVTWKI